MSIFNKRHYEWLARFAGKYLDGETAQHLLDELKQENSSFNPVKFSNAYCNEIVRQHSPRTPNHYYEIDKY